MRVATPLRAVGDALRRRRHVVPVRRAAVPTRLRVVDSHERRAQRYDVQSHQRFDRLPSHGPVESLV